MSVKVIEHKGAKYIPKADVEAYKAEQIESIQKLKDGIQEAKVGIEKIDNLYASEERREKAEQVISKFKDIDFHDVEPLFNFDDDEAFSEVYQYFERLAAPVYPEPTPGGRRKAAQPRSREDYGRELFARVKGKR